MAFELGGHHGQRNSNTAENRGSLANRRLGQTSNMAPKLVPLPP